MKLPPLRTLRRTRRARIVSRHGQMRALFIAGGLAVGLIAVGFAILADLMQGQFARLVAIAPWAALLVTPLGFALSAFMARRYFPNSGGSGIPQAIAARALEFEGPRRRLVSIRVAIGKVALTALGLLCGASIGREGPTVQVGASVMYWVGHLSPRRQRGLILAGSAAGVAAAFNAPLAGIVFGIEEMGRSFEQRSSGMVISTVIAAGLVALALQGNHSYFGSTGLTVHGVQDWMAVPLCGAVGGAAGGLFSRFVIACAGAWTQRGAWLKQRPVLFATLCGLVMALCGLAAGGSVYGTGYEQVVDMLNGAHPGSLWFGLLKFVATLASAVSSIPGGIFSPSLAVGAGIGRDLAELLTAVPLPIMVVLGMVSYFSGVVQAPITAFVIVTEMTDNNAMVVPLMLAALIGFAVSRLICPDGIYHAPLAQLFARWTSSLNLLRGWTVQPIVAALVAIIAGYAGAIVLVIQAAQAAHLAPALLSSWIAAISLGCGVSGIALSLIYRAPISVAWSTPGAALLVVSLPNVTYPEAIGAYVMAGIALLALAATGLFDRVMRHVPAGIAAAMLAGILFRFGADTWLSLGREPVLIGTMAAIWLIGRRLAPRFAVSLSLIAGVALAAFRGQTDFSNVHLALAHPVLTLPIFSLAAAVNIAIPLLLVAITGQYLPGFAVLRTAGYDIPPRPMVATIGTISLLLAPFGCHGVNNAAITAAIIAGPEAHDDPRQRWRAGIAMGLMYLVIALFGATLAALFAALPRELIAAIAGLALLGAIMGGLTAALSDPTERDAALITFLCTASGMSLFGLGAPFWGLAIGLAAQPFLRPRIPA